MLTEGGQVICGGSFCRLPAESPAVVVLMAVPFWRVPVRTRSPLLSRADRCRPHPEMLTVPPETYRLSTWKLPAITENEPPEMLTVPLLTSTAAKPPAIEPPEMFTVPLT